MTLSPGLEKFLCCPECYGVLVRSEDMLFCACCDLGYPCNMGRPNFLRGPGPETADSVFQQEQMYETTFRAKLFNLGSRYVSSDYTPIDHLGLFMQEIPENAVVVELGSGNRRLCSKIINIDLFGFPNVDIVSDIQKTPLPSDAVDYAIVDTVLEHVPEPHAVAGELLRILKPGGRVLCIAPFIFNYHGYPAHYFNFSKDGLEQLFREYSDCSVSMNVGPTSAMTNLVSEYFALALSRNSRLAYTILKGLMLLPIFCFKYLDRLWARSPNAHRMASTLCAIATK